jgi:DNA adenine methylase
MHYLGGKARLAKHIVPFLVEKLQPEGRFIEPFVGGFNIVPELRKLAPGFPGRRIYCGDAHYGLIVLYRALRNGTFTPPDTLSPEEYTALKARKDWSDPRTTFAAFGCSFMGMAFTSYARDNQGTNYCLRAKNGLLKKLGAMTNVNFYWGRYEAAHPHDGDVVYADPPYRDTAEYAGTPQLDYENFYVWCEAAARAGAAVFVSEFTVPQRRAWIPVWSTTRKALRSVKEKVDYLIEVRP